MTEEEFKRELRKRAQAITDLVRHTLTDVQRPDGVSEQTHITFVVLGTLATRIAALEINNERISKLLTDLLAEEPNDNLH